MSCSIIKEVYQEVLYYPVAEQCGYRVLELYALNLMFVFFLLTSLLSVGNSSAEKLTT